MTQRKYSSKSAFTLVEVMIAMTIFMMVMASIYACWASIVKGTKVGENAAAKAQRARVAVHTVEQALMCAQCYSYNNSYYTFQADSSNERFSALEFTARLPDTFLGGGYFGNQVMRHVTFYVKAGEDRQNNLVMRQFPLLDANEEKDPYEIVLARDVTRFSVEYWRPGDKDFSPDFLETNQLPKLVRITMGIGHVKNDFDRPNQVMVRLVNIPCDSALTPF